MTHGQEKKSNESGDMKEKRRNGNEERLEEIGEGNESC